MNTFGPLITFVKQPMIGYYGENQSKEKIKIKASKMVLKKDY